MKKILCPTDFSDTAQNAIAYASKLAKNSGASLTLFNVRSLASLTPDEAIAGESQNLHAARVSLEELCDEVRKVFKISCYGDVAASVISVDTMISSHAQDYDLVVMGSNGPDDIAQFFLGSNTYQVIRKTSTPLIMIPDKCGFSDIKKIIYAFDYWRSNGLPLGQLIHLTKILGSELVVLQIMEESYSRKAEEEMLAMQEVFLDLYKNDIPLSFDTIYTANLTDGLHDYVLSKKADVLALSTNNHGFLQRLFHKSVVKEMSAKATYPLFVFHA